MVVAGRWEDDTGITRNAPDSIRSQVIAPLASFLSLFFGSQDEKHSIRKHERLNGA
jgi:hypothetical protein